jgi:3D (Asp-Asp-Asp) domain-containing protein
MDQSLDEADSAMMRWFLTLVLLTTMCLTYGEVVESPGEAAARWIVSPVSDFIPDEHHWEDFLEVRTMRVTAYTAGKESTGKSPGHPAYGITSSGRYVHLGVVAAPKEFPYGTILWIEGYGYGIVADRGKAIRGNRLDIYMESVRKAREWGVQVVEVRILRWGR